MSFEHGSDVFQQQETDVALLRTLGATLDEICDRCRPTRVGRF